jgi:hypothetical protein
VPSFVERLARRAASRDQLSRRDLVGGGTDPRSIAPGGQGLEHVARLLATAPVSRRRALGLAGVTVAGLALGRPGRASADCGCPLHTTCCSSWEPCCATEEQGVVCTENYLCCQPGKKVCFGSGDPHAACCDPSDPCYVYPDGSGGCFAPCPSGQAQCGRNCCPPGQVCTDPATFTCKCPSGQTMCGSTCCTSSQICCDIGKQGLCCDQNVACCNVGSTQNQPVGNSTCCQPQDHCTEQLDAVLKGITPDSPFVCCPPGRFVAAGIGFCCPPGQVPNSGDRFLVPTGYCCTVQNVCGPDCCDSIIAKYPKRCIQGRSRPYCDFEFIITFGSVATANSSGTVSLEVQSMGPATGSMSIQIGGASGAQARGPAAGPVTIGHTSFRVSRRGKHKIKIHLSPKGRALLTRRRRLSVNVVMTLTAGRKSERTVKPFTLLASRH